MVDVGLTTGIKDLWQENLLRDYTLIVEGHEFQVHKLVLAAVSKYFKAMLGEGYMESKTNKVEVKGFSADIVGKLLEFIYTGKENVITDNTLEVLRCSMYLQMPLVSQFCVKKLLKDLNVENCVEVLSAMVEFAFPKEVTELRYFIQRNWGVVMENCDLKTLSSDTVQLLMDCWPKCELDMFLFVKNWIHQDYQNRIGFVNDLMSRVRFCLVSPEDLQAIMQMGIYQNNVGPWHHLVVNAVKYHQMPINLKVLDKSEQSEVKTEPVPSFFSPEYSEVDFFSLDDEKKWVKQEQKCFKEPVKELPDSVCLVVNNFLIVCHSDYQNQIWQIFDPRNLTWSTIPSMDKPKVNFAMVHHNDILYTVGGEYIPDVPCCDMHQFSLLRNSWSSVHKLPVSLSQPAACILGDRIYVSGGWVNSEDESDGLYCLNPSSHTRDWDTKASCLWEFGGHQMCILKRSGEEGLFIIDSDLKMQFYSPSNNQWSEITNATIPDGFKYAWLDDGIVFFRDNTVFVLNMYLPGHERSVCRKLTIPEKGRKVTKVEIQDLPQSDLHIFGAILAISPQNVKC